MATVFSEANIAGLRKAHFEQLQAYLEWAENSGTYYGNKKQFNNRHKEIKKWINNIVETANEEGIIIPKK